MKLPKVILIFVVSITSSDCIAQSQPFTSLLGEWIGKGTASGVGVADSVSFERVDFSDQHIRFKLKEIGGQLEMEGFFYTLGNGAYEFYEFNNGTWPTRIFKGSFDEDRFNLIEETEDRKILLEIILINEHVFHLKETFLMKDGELLDEPELFVNELFSRITRE